MSRYILESNGKILSSLVASADMLELNTASNAIYCDVDEERDMTDYYDFDLQSFVSIGDPPSPSHVFDYNFKQWIDKRTLLDIKAQKWTEIKVKRNAFEFGGFTFEGIQYDSDQVSQGRILGASLAYQDQVWTAADNTVVTLTATKMVELYQRLQLHVAVAHERGRIAREAIQAATTKDQVEAIVF